MKWVGEQPCMPPLDIRPEDPEDTLIDKINKPIETGGMLAGWLFFPLKAKHRGS
jgi:hypothetical protein